MGEQEPPKDHKLEMNFADVRRSRAEIERARQNYYAVESSLEETRSKILDSRNRIHELRFEIAQLENSLPDQLIAAKINTKQVELESVSSNLDFLKSNLVEDERALEVSRIELDKITVYEPNVEKSEIAIDKFEQQLASYRARIEAENSNQANRNMAERDRMQQADYEREIEEYEKRLNSAVQARQRISGFIEQSALAHAKQKSELETKTAKTEDLLKANLE